jgi:hypothetical protein
MSSEHQAAVKIEPDGIRFRFTRWVRHRRLPPSRISCCALYLNRGDRCGNQRVIRGMRAKICYLDCPPNSLDLRSIFVPETFRGEAVKLRPSRIAAGLIGQTWPVEVARA